MIFSQQLKTSDRITLYFSLFNFVSLILLLVCINITYFFIWYNELKQESLYDMTKNYSALIGNSTIDNKKAFREYILQKDTIIIPESEEQGLTCSDGVAAKLHNDMALLEEVQHALFYKDDGDLYFIFSRHYEGIGHVRIFFDTSQYIHNQLIIIKVSALMILLWFFIYLLGGRLISKWALKDLQSISATAKKIDLNKKYQNIHITGRDDDEIKILADTLNKAFGKIETQSTGLKQFITDVSHEFKTPLMIMNSDIDLYEKKKEKNLLHDSDDLSLTKSMKSKTHKLNSLIETLFLLTRMEENISNIQLRKRNIKDLIEHIADEQIKAYTHKTVDIQFLGKTNILLDLEESSFRIVIQNLIGNALKFSKESTHIDVDIQENYFQIRDSGIGMDTEALKNIWGKFYKHDQNKEGFGVGLFLVKRIIKLYHWRIEVDSQKGLYSTFKVYFTK